MDMSTRMGFEKRATVVQQCYGTNGVCIKLNCYRAPVPTLVLMLSPSCEDEPLEEEEELRALAEGSSSAPMRMARAVRDSRRTPWRGGRRDESEMAASDKVKARERGGRME